MLGRCLILFYLFILLTNIIAQRYDSNIRNVDSVHDDKGGLNRLEKPIQPPSLNANQMDNKFSMSNVRNNDGQQRSNFNQQQQPVQQQQQQQPIQQQQQQPIQPYRSNFRSSTPISGSIECQLDVQKYCTNGNKQLISNLKVLQCIDDLDNVSFQKL